MDLTKDDLIAILKARLLKSVDLRGENPYGLYNDPYKRMDWDDSFFQSKNEAELKRLIEIYNG